MDIYEIAEKIDSKEEFVIFLKKLKDDLNRNKDDWDNNTLSLYLEGLYGYSLDNKNEIITWKEFAKYLLAARVYE